MLPFLMSTENKVHQIQVQVAVHGFLYILEGQNLVWFLCWWISKSCHQYRQQLIVSCNSTTLPCLHKCCFFIHGCFVDVQLICLFFVNKSVECLSTANRTAELNFYHLLVTFYFQWVEEIVYILLRSSRIYLFHILYIVYI